MKISQIKIPQLILIFLLFIFSSVQPCNAQETDILDFLPAILAAAVHNDNNHTTTTSTSTTTTLPPVTTTTTLPPATTTTTLPPASTTTTLPGGGGTTTTVPSASTTTTTITTTTTTLPSVEHHLISSRWGVLSDTDLGALSYGWAWMDIEGLTTDESTATVRNICKTGTAMVTEQGNLGPVVLGGAGDCVEEDVATISVDESETTVTYSGVSHALTNLSYTDNSPDFAFGTGGVRNFGNTFYADNQFYRLSFLAKKTQDATIDDIVGDWGIFRLETEVTPNQEVLYTTLSFPAEISSAAGGTLTTVENTHIQIESEFIHYPDGSPVLKRRFEFKSWDVNFPISISPDGEVSIEVGDTGQPGRSAQTLDGFVSPDGNFIVLSEGVPSIDALRDGETSPPPLEEFSAHQLMLALKRDSAPDLAGHTYNIVGFNYWIKNDGFAITDWRGGSTITFTDSVSGEFNIANELGMVAFANNDTLGVTTQTDIQGPIPFGYSIDGSDGRIMLDISALPGIEDDLINGYASVGGEVILLSIGIAYCDADDCTGEVATSGDIGMWVGICTNCTP